MLQSKKTEDTSVCVKCIIVVLFYLVIAWSHFTASGVPPSNTLFVPFTREILHRSLIINFKYENDVNREGSRVRAVCGYD